MTIGIFVDVFPLGTHVGGLGDRVFAHTLGIEGIGTKLAVEDGHAQLIFDALVEITGRLAAVHIGAVKVELAGMLGHEVEVEQVAPALAHGR